MLSHRSEIVLKIGICFQGADYDLVIRDPSLEATFRRAVMQLVQIFLTTVYSFEGVQLTIDGPLERGSIIAWLTAEFPQPSATMSGAGTDDGTGDVIKESFAKRALENSVSFMDSCLTYHHQQKGGCDGPVEGGGHSLSSLSDPTGGASSGSSSSAAPPASGHDLDSPDAPVNRIMSCIQILADTFNCCGASRKQQLGATTGAGNASSSSEAGPSTLPVSCFPDLLHLRVRLRLYYLVDFLLIDFHLNYRYILKHHQISPLRWHQWIPLWWQQRIPLQW